MTVKYFKIILSFIITTSIMCVVNFIAQIALIFMDVVSRLESSSALTLVLWFVTGVFGAIFTEATAGMFMKKEEITYSLVHYPILIISMMMIVLAVVLMLMGELEADNVEFTLIFSNGFVSLSYFLGAGGFSFIARKL
jgi:hypothetical protein